MELQYIGEHLLLGQIGHFLVILSFVSSLLATTAYFFSTRFKERTDSWKKMGRVAFIIHGLSILGVISTIFYLMVNQYYEYHYAWAHVSQELPMKYIFSAFWEGQEGSFLLWMFWHIILGSILMLTSGKWETRTMPVLTSIQVFINSMILGLYITPDFKLGSSPFLLLRDVIDAPIFNTPDYLSLISGTGLNPLLQNYWMTIHPPTLFLGFAATTIPFCFAIAGLWKKDYTGWLKPVLPWALFAGAILGTGVLMGGAWAYEALSFGGYWAWDPVENMSLVPWLILIAGIHANLIGKVTGYSIRSTFVFYLLSFIMIVYSTFLTRSGILGDTSVHAFTEMGLEWQLVLFIVFYVLLSAGLYFFNRKNIRPPEREEAIYAREFWMFVGTLVLLFSAILITFTTSIPVYNKIFDAIGLITNSDLSSWHRTSPLEPEAHYNKYQLWIAVFVAILSSASQYLRYKGLNWASYKNKFAMHALTSLILSIGVALLVNLWIKTPAWQYTVLLWASCFAIISNLDYLVSFIKGNIKIAGSVFAHLGFGLMLLGILSSGLNKRVISNNQFAQSGLFEENEEDKLKNNIILLKGEPMFMNDYQVTYRSDTLINFERRFEINYQRKGEEGQIIEEFNLYPNVLYDRSFTNIASSNPSTKRYLDKDIFTHIASLPRAEVDPRFAKESEDSLKYKLHEIFIGDTIFLKDQYAILKNITNTPIHPDYKPESEDIGFGAEIKFFDKENNSYGVSSPAIVLREQILIQLPSQLNKARVKVKLNESIFEQLYAQNSDLIHQEVILKEKDSISINGVQFRLAGFNRNPKHNNYSFEDGDIAVGATIQVSTPEGGSFELEPVYLIRDGKPFNIKDENLSTGIHTRFLEINPTEETFRFSLSVNPRKVRIPLEIAEDVMRTDYLVLEAILFPGINFFWLGSSLMMVGLALAFYRRLKA